MYPSYGNAVPHAGNKSVEATIRELVQDFCTAFNTGNYDQCARIFAPDGFLMPPSRDAVQGIKPIERTLQQLADLGYGDVRMETTRVDVSTEIAVEMGKYTASIRLENGATVVDRGKYLTSWHRLGAWRIMATCWSTNLPRIADLESDRQPPDSVESTEGNQPNSQKSA